ncbi:hypothetical protein [Rhizobium sp. SYY.PMSO]|uniref:hypothetical protein n=1 Tax=Rhizobium sp. SYY.PMSO TaxID=3382192 RepID=UPI00399002A6
MTFIMKPPKRQVWRLQQVLYLAKQSRILAHFALGKACPPHYCKGLRASEHIEAKRWNFKSA